MRELPSHVLFALLMAVSSLAAWSQNNQCDGGALKTQEAFLYGRFETRMSSTQGSGIVSSFFLYNWDLDCNSGLSSGLRTCYESCLKAFARTKITTGSLQI